MRARTNPLVQSIQPHALTRSASACIDQRTAPDGVNSLCVVTASIAHEISQPLSGIIANASACLRMLNADAPNLEGARETARRTLRDVNRALEVINRLRALYARTAIASDPVDLNEAVLEALALSRPELDASRVTVLCALADRLPLVLGDSVQLQQVVQNLVRNAAEAMIGVQDGPRELTISTRLHEINRVQLSVRDAGMGFRCEDADRLFTPFYTTKAHGMGIGLSVSRSIVEHHCGRLWGTPNDDGRGATFSVSIPCASNGSTHGGRGSRHVAAAADALALVNAT